MTSDTQAPSTTDISYPQKKSTIKQYVVLFIVIAIFAAAITYYWHYSEQHPSTDDAYVHAEILSVAPQISGPILEIHVDDFQHVNKGDLLIKIDPQPYQLAVQQAQAAYQLAVQQNKAQDSEVSAGVAAVEAAREQLKEAQIEYDRQIKLVKQKLAPAQTGDTYKNQLAQAQANLERSRADLQQAISSRGGSGKDSAVVQQAAAQLGQAELNLSYTEITAPFDGILGDVTVQEHSVVGVGQQLFPLVRDNSYWIQANYKETDLTRLKEGQKATISVDMHPDYQWTGHVAKLSPASGNSFSLLPTENATGNWVKIKQRFPVKIKIDNKDDAPALRVGASAVVTINTINNRL